MIGDILAVCIALSIVIATYGLLDRNGFAFLIGLMFAYFSILAAIAGFALGILPA